MSKCDVVILLKALITIARKSACVVVVVEIMSVVLSLANATFPPS